MFRRTPEPHITSTVTSIAEPQMPGGERIVVADNDGHKSTYALPADSNITLEVGRPYGFILEGRTGRPPIIESVIPTAPTPEALEGGAKRALDTLAISK